MIGYSHIGLDSLVHDHQMLLPALVSPKTTGRPAGSADIRVLRILKHLFHLVLGDAVLASML